MGRKSTAKVILVLGFFLMHTAIGVSATTADKDGSALAARLKEIDDKIN
jgi:hypothetical protein